VKTTLQHFGILWDYVKLGEVGIPSELTEKQLQNLYDALIKQGLELKRETEISFHDKVKIAINEWLNDNEKNKLLRSEFLADKFCITYDTLAANFKMSEGVTIDKYCVRCRIEKAKELLLNSDYSVYTILTQLNFKSETLFYRQFKEDTKMTPEEYRLRYK